MTAASTEHGMVSVILAVSAWCALTGLGLPVLHQVRGSLYAALFGAPVDPRGDVEDPAPVAAEHRGRRVRIDRRWCALV